MRKAFFLDAHVFKSALISGSVFERGSSLRTFMRVPYSSISNVNSFPVRSFTMASNGAVSKESVLQYSSIDDIPTMVKRTFSGVRILI